LTDAAFVFLSSIGYRSNTLVMGSGGYSRMELPFEMSITLMPVSGIVYVWPL